MYVRTPTFISVRRILDMCTLRRTLIFSLWFFKVFKIFLALIILYCLKTCCIFDLYLFVLGWDRFFIVNIYFKETLYSNFSYKLFNKYFSLLQSTCQFRVSVSKISGIELSDLGIVKYELFLVCSKSKTALPQLFHEL